MTDDYLSSAERARLVELQNRDAFVRDVLAQVKRILASRRFERVQQRGRDFLTHIVSKVLLGQADQIKETTIAMAVFGEPADFDPAETAKVRVAAADLRLRLTAYAEQEDKDDPVTILVPPSTYVPTILDRRVTIEVVGFENWNPQDEQDHLRRAFVSEVAYQLREAGFRVSDGPTLALGQNRHRYALRGSLECSDNGLHVNVSLADPSSGRIVSSQSLEDGRDAILKLARAAFEAVVAALTAVGASPALAGVRSRKQP